MSGGQGDPLPLTYGEALTALTDAVETLEEPGAQVPVWRVVEEYAAGKVLSDEALAGARRRTQGQGS